ncbi:bifunctional diaminohydroxyphosphoribosylaminopyrimidine deaminase/5-amino-6-(5-phosphoribosylamino)uracil reductase RibD [Propionivibrio dicarboxylicus]|uniref:Riboflavin biosynthesis protein RibD n=1 Tax=Propionivibrio dicarboxylicus TaxID=83767 RepID=A0A1G8IHT7_9RHOO|nr:bifunctional diaminohydroxyphosphoribosylaminopyrimidine deaminase/5-amino-6-(5-phosphoribosylamino)uracil reductase RibD [Propionivibrio dicarboxylicus]SDI18090.1 diaminohydroxyphosphoribosylaminopyrimidine deaminase [Propionivibrio dicarboxylicus]
MFSVADHEFMARALRLAELGLWTTSPNPRVGCVLVKDGRIVGEGWHRRAGEAHAEIHALKAAGADALGAVAYVTLEPCSHFGRTPPCAKALIDAGVSRVVAAMQDPNPEVSGRGLAMLREAGIEVVCGLLEAEARELNIGFVSRMTRQRPWVRLKMAASLDGRTALANGQSQWITGAAARQDGHRWRARACAILTGMGTVRDDDPQLTVRGVDTTRQPLRVVVDGRLEISPSARVLGSGTVIATASEEGALSDALRARGAEVWSLANTAGRVDLSRLLTLLAQRGINEVHVEAGRGLSGALFAAGLVDELLLYMAPCLLGSDARGLVDLPELSSLAEKVALKISDLRVLGDDLRILARVVPAKAP